MWFDIIKDKLVNVQHSGGIQVTKPNVANVVDGPCNRKLMEYADKLRNIEWRTKPVKALEEFWKDKTPDGIVEQKNNTRSSIFYRSYDKKHAEQMMQSANYMIGNTEEYSHYAHPIPEDVACKALDLLSNLKEGDTMTKVNINRHEIMMKWEEDNEKDNELKVMFLYIKRHSAYDKCALRIYIRNTGLIENITEVTADWR
jgi:folylpolyglutamate synthase/dihydropteroate synthase